MITFNIFTGTFDFVGSSDGSSSTAESYQKYFVASSETYTIPNSISSVITGPMIIEGVVVIEGRLEII